MPLIPEGDRALSASRGWWFLTRAALQELRAQVKLSATKGVFPECCESAPSTGFGTCAVPGTGFGRQNE